MAEYLTFENVEAVVVDYLNGVQSVHATRVVDDGAPDEYVKVLLTGTSRRSITMAESRVTIECHALTDARAEAIARDVYGWMCALHTPTAWIPDGEAGWAGGPYATVDPTRGTPRYDMTANVRQAAVSA